MKSRGKNGKKNNLRQFRFFQNITQDQLAVLTGYDQSLISRLERGVLRQTPGTEKMKIKVSEVLGFPKAKVFPKK